MFAAIDTSGNKFSREDIRRDSEECLPAKHKEGS